MQSVLKSLVALVVIATPVSAQRTFRVRPVNHVGSAQIATPAQPESPKKPTPQAAVPKKTAPAKTSTRVVAQAPLSTKPPATKPVPLVSRAALVAPAIPSSAVAVVAPAKSGPKDAEEMPVAQPRVATDSLVAAKEEPKAAPNPAPATVATTATAAAPAPAKAPAMMALSLGSVLFAGNIQTFYMAGSSDVINTFKIRRAEMKFVGTLSPTVRWTMMVDPAKALKVSSGVANQTTTILQDAYITLKVKQFDITAGQFLIPLTYEGSGYSVVVLETYDRSLMVTDGKFGQVRDLGAMIGGPLTSALKFRLGLFNGTGESQNTPDVNGQKAVIGRLEMQTPVTGLRLGTSGAYGGANATDNPRHDRVGTDVEYNRRKLGLRGEIMKGWDGTDIKLGYYGVATYMIRDDVMLVSRYDAWDKDARATPKGELAKERDLLLGTSWLLQGTNVQLRTNYVFRYLNNTPQRDQIVVSLQTAW